MEIITIINWYEIPGRLFDFLYKTANLLHFTLRILHILRETMSVIQKKLYVSRFLLITIDWILNKAFRHILFVNLNSIHYTAEDNVHCTPELH